MGTSLITTFLSPSTRAAITLATSSGEVARMVWRRGVGGLADSAGFGILVSSTGLDLAIVWRSACATAPHARCFHNLKPRTWARRCRSRWPDAFSATNDISMNASFVVEVQLNVRGLMSIE